MPSALASRMGAVALRSGQSDDEATNCDLVRVTETTALDRRFSLDPAKCRSAHDRVVMRKVVGIGLAAVVALIVAGFILGGYLDATGASSIPGLPWLIHQPQPLRI